MLAKHFSDEQLLHHLDGELSPRVDRAIQKHLKACWKCRFRMAALEQQIQAVAQELDHETFPGPDWILEARYRFALSEEAFERDFSSAPQFRLTSSLVGNSIRAGAIATALMVAVIIGVGILMPWRRQPLPNPREALAISQKAESFLDSSSVHQSIRVEVVQLQPVRQRRLIQLEVWSDAERERFSSKLKSSDGTLTHALWRPDGGHEFVYNAARSQEGVTRLNHSHRTASFAEISLDGLSIEQLEEGFTRWLESRHWRPISFAHDLAIFAGSHGAVLHAERIRTPSGSTGVRLSARRHGMGLTVEFMVEGGSLQDRPRMQLIRFETADSVFEVRLTSERTQLLKPELVNVELFRPDIPLLEASIGQAKVRTPLFEDSSPRAQVARRSLAPKLDAAELLALEVEARYALHRMKACRGEPITVAGGPDGRIIVQGLAATPQRKTELVRALEALQAARAVTVNIRTIEEAAQAYPSMGSAIPPASEAIRMRSGQIPIQAELEYFFTQSNGSDIAPGLRSKAAAAEVSRAITELSNRAITMAATSLADAWALRRLAERYKSEDLPHLQPRTLRVLEVMIRDHLADLTEDFNNYQTVLRPALASLVEHGAGGSIEQLPGRGASSGALGRAPLADSSWESIMAIFETVRRMDSLTRGLFVGYGLPLEMERNAYEGEFAATEVPEQAAIELLQVFQNFEASLRKADLQVASDFLFNPEIVTANQQ